MPFSRSFESCSLSHALKVELASSILCLLLPAYEQPVPNENQSSIIRYTSQVMPPLSDWDNAKLSIILPVLSVMLFSNEIDSNSDKASLELMCSYLVEYSLDKDNHSTPRRAAASCVFSIVSKYDASKQNCLGMLLCKNNICSPLSVQLDGDRNVDISSEVIEDSFNFLALLVCFFLLYLLSILSFIIFLMLTLGVECGMQGEIINAYNG